MSSQVNNILLFTFTHFNTFSKLDILILFNAPIIKYKSVLYFGGVSQLYLFFTFVKGNIVSYNPFSPIIPKDIFLSL